LDEDEVPGQHLFQKYMKKNQGQKRKRNGADDKSVKKKPQCLLCHQTGHNRRTCPMAVEEDNSDRNSKKPKRTMKKKHVADFIGAQDCDEPAPPSSQIEPTCQMCNNNIVESDCAECGDIYCNEKMHRACFDATNFTCHPVDNDGFAK
jgi:hypothetical protein